MDHIRGESYNLNITRYVSTDQAEEAIELSEVHENLTALGVQIRAATQQHNAFLKELGLPALPGE